jgi:hypothetical protein
MKDIKVTWFLDQPIDNEHKQYILLDFLKSVNKEIEKDNIYYPIKKIFTLIKDLKVMDLILEGKSLAPEEIGKREKIISDSYQELGLSEDENIELKEIVEVSLGCLYRYAELGTSLWKNVEKRINTFSFSGENQSKDFGILILRNMASDEVHTYWWSRYKSSITSSGILMKRVNLLNSYFSLSYEFIVHEMLQNLGMKALNPQVTVMEISEDFNVESNVLKVAKELFIREMENSDH